MKGLLFLLLLQFSLAALGASAVAVVALIWKRPMRWYGYVLTKLGAAAVIGIILVLVLPQGEVQASGRAYGYIAGVGVYALGVAIVAKDIMQRAGRRSAVGGKADWNDEPPE